MFPTINESRFNGTMINGTAGGHGGANNNHYGNFQFGTRKISSTTNSNGRRSLSEEEQHLYNHHIIENFVESVREMNDVVLIPSKLRDLDPTPPPNMTKKYVQLNDDLHSYYQMINVVKNDLFEPHNEETRKIFPINRQRKISRQHRREQEQQQQSTTTNNGNGNGASSNGNGSGLQSRNHSSSNLSAMSNGNNGTTTSSTNGYSNGHTNGNHSDQDNCPAVSHTTNGNGEASAMANGNGSNSTVSGPLTADQLIGQTSKQLTLQFIHHINSLYTILEHFTNAADFITERYSSEVELSC